MHRALAISLAFAACPLARAQLLPQEAKALSDTLFLNNLTLQDLNYFRRPVQDAYPIDLIHQCIDKPLEGADKLMELHEKAYLFMPSDLIRTARMDMLGDAAETRTPLPAAKMEPIPAVVPANVQPAIQELSDAVSEANQYVHMALRRLTPKEKRLLIDNLPQWAVGGPMTNFDFVRSGQAASQEQILSLLQKVNLPLIRRSSEVLATVAERRIPDLLLAAKTMSWQGEARFPYRGINVVVCGAGQNTLSEKNANLIVSFGPTQYAGREGAGVLGASLLIDFAGGAKFEQKDLGVGTGYLGIGLAYVLGGNNTLRSGSISFGSGIAGVGVLQVEGADNHYSADALSEGYGLFGIGALMETGGGSTFEGTWWSQAASRTQGVGWLIGGQSGDLFRLEGMSLSGGQTAASKATGASSPDSKPLDPTSYIPHSTSQPPPDSELLSYGQAYSCGFGADKDALSGGISLLTAGKGSDTFIGGDRCQASADKFSLASLYQASGAHNFVAAREAQGFAAGQSASFLFALDGSGAFVLKDGEGQAYAVADSVCMLLNRQGDNSFIGDGSGQSQAIDKGLALFIHDWGRDRIDPLSGGGVNTGMGDSLGVLVDIDAAQDSSVASVRPGMGLALEIPNARHAVMGENVSRALPKPGSQSLPVSVALDALYARATDPNLVTPERNQAEDQWIAFGKPGLDWLVANRLPEANLEGRLLIGLVAKEMGPDGINEIALRIADPNDDLALNSLRICVMEGFSEAKPLIEGTLSRQALQKDGVSAAGQFKATEAASTLMVLAGQPDKDLVVRALNSLAAIADPNSLSTGQVLLGSNDFLVREAAINLVASLPNGLDTAKALVKDPEEATARTGIQILAKIGTTDALDLIGQELTNMKSGVRMQALLALSGRIPAKYQTVAAAMKNDPSPLVRAVLAGLSR